MNNKKVVFLIVMVIVIVVAFVVGLVAGLGIGSNENKAVIRELNPIKKSCTYENKVYRSGEKFPAGDGCNSCGCQDGKVACTVMACDPR